jgi:FAD/FMN-containing dehydrogenase
VPPDRREEVKMIVATVEESQLERLRETFAGSLIGPHDAGFEEARRIHNGLIDMRPALIARCLGTPDVVNALRLGREAGLEVAVRGGAHGVAGFATTDGGIVIDLSAMKGVYVDSGARTARAQAGVTWRELDRENGLFGLAVTGGTVSTTGIAGLTLGGGFGWLMGLYGLTADNLLSAQVVSAKGEVLATSAHENADLFWAIRGGGGNFGVVTSFEYRLHPVEQITGGIVAHAFDGAPDVLRSFREFVADAPDELGLVAALVHAPDGSGVPLAALVVCHAGDREQAGRDLAPVLGFGGPVLSEVGVMPYPEVNTLLDAAYPAGALNYWKSSFLADLTDEAIDALVAHFAAVPSPMTAVAIESFHGAVTRVGIGETAVPHREPGFNVLITSVWTDPAETEENVEWTRDLYDALRPFLADRRYANYLSSDDGNAARAAYGPNYARLAEVKRKYDPDNVLRRNVNILPAAR